MKVPCEVIIWYLLPEVRSEIAKYLVEKFDHSQKEVADMMGVTPATICQYFKSKRGNRFIKEIKDPALRKMIRNEIARSALKIEEQNIPFEAELCRICRIAKSGELLSELYHTFENGDPPQTEIKDSEGDGSSLKCPHCSSSIEVGWKACPHCGERLLDSCPKCGGKLEVDWKVCPNCTEKLF